MASHFSSASAHGGDTYKIEMTAFSHGCVQLLTQGFMESLDSQTLVGHEAKSWTMHRSATLVISVTGTGWSDSPKEKSSEGETD